MPFICTTLRYRAVYQIGILTAIIELLKIKGPILYLHGNDHTQSLSMVLSRHKKRIDYYALIADQLIRNGA